jgi:hypothetical protein
MAWFYGVYLVEKRLEAALELIRFLGEPDYLRRPHITIRGPYERRQDALLEKLKYTHKSILIKGVTAFFVEAQNTVLLDCHLPDKDRVWRKPDFPDGKPHITIYDGKSRNMALNLRSSLKTCKWNFQVPISDLTLIEKKIDPQETAPEIFENVSELYGEVMFEEFSVENIRSFAEIDSIFCVSRLAAYISKNFPPELSRKRVTS